MNLPWKENAAFRQVLLGCLLILFVSTLFYVIGFLGSSVSGLDLFARANSTRTSIALTSNALMGPFPTSTGPTPTASRTRTITPTPTIPPSDTPSPTPFRYFINTGTPRTLVPRAGLTFTSAAPAASSTPFRPTSRPTSQPSTSIPPTSPVVQPTRPPQQPTNPPRKATKTSKPPRPTKTPKKSVPMVECVDPQVCFYFLSEKAPEFYSWSGFGNPD